MYVHLQYSPPSLICGFCSPWFQLPTVNHNLQILNGKFPKYMIHKFELCSIWNNLINLCHPTLFLLPRM